MKKLLLLLPVIAGIFWGSVGIFVRELTAFGVDTYTILSSRVMLASIILFVGFLAFDRSLLKIKWRDLWVFIAAGLLGTFALNLCYNESINHLTLSLSAVLLSLSPLFVIILAAIFFRERITRRKIGCMLLAILGCLLVSGVLESASGLHWSAWGIFAGVLSAFFYALYSLFSKIAMGRGYQALTITFYSFLIFALFLLPVTDWAVLRDFVAAAPLKNAAFMLLHSLCSSVLPYACFTLALRYNEVGKVSILASGGEPSAAMVFGILFFAEVPSLLNLLGLILVIIVLSVLCLPDKPKARPQHQIKKIRHGGRVRRTKS